MVCDVVHDLQGNGFGWNDLECEVKWYSASLK